MSWAIWLAVPAACTVLASLAVWWRGRPPRIPGVRDTMRAHSEYLDALAIPAREGRSRAE